MNYDEINEEDISQNNFEIGIELVNLLQRNTNLSHTLCSKSVIDLISHLIERLPNLKNTTNGLVDVIQV